jgi:hypothetical protein
VQPSSSSLVNSTSVLKTLHPQHPGYPFGYILEIIKTADYLIDLGPEGGDGGGRLVAAGPPEEVAQHPDSHTGRFLRQILQ